MKILTGLLLALLLFYGSDIQAQPSVVINEINYNSPENADAEDWVEIYNRSGAQIDISGWVIKDANDDNAFVFPNGTILEAGEYLAAVRDIDAFSAVHPNASNFIGSIDFNFSNGGELIRLFNASSTLIDQVEYDDEGDWTTEPDGNGPSLELINYDLDNDVASNWGASSGNGTPGAANSILSTSAESETSPLTFRLNQNYPNPFNPNTVISYQLALNSDVDLRIYDMLGREVAVLINKAQSAGSHSVTWNASGLNSGMYYYRLVAGGQAYTRKMTLIK